MAIAFCPDCEEPVRVATPKLGQRVTCESCGGELEIVEVSPLELDWAYDEPADDWEDEEETDDWDDEEEDDDWDDEEEDDWDDTDPAAAPFLTSGVRRCRGTGEEETSEDTDDQ